MFMPCCHFLFFDNTKATTPSPNKKENIVDTHFLICLSRSYCSFPISFGFFIDILSFKCGKYHPELQPEITTSTLSSSFCTKFLPSSKTLGNVEHAIPCTLK